jgi:hypothetical protein
VRRLAWVAVLLTGCAGDELKEASDAVYDLERQVSVDRVGVLGHARGFDNDLWVDAFFEPGPINYTPLDPVRVLRSGSESIRYLRLGLANHASHNWRCVCLILLGRLKATEVVDRVAELSEGAEAADLRRLATVVLGMIGGDDTLRRLRKAPPSMHRTLALALAGGPDAIKEHLSGFRKWIEERTASEKRAGMRPMLSARSPRPEEARYWQWMDDLRKDWESSGAIDLSKPVDPPIRPIDERLRDPAEGPPNSDEALLMILGTAQLSDANLVPALLECVWLDPYLSFDARALVFKILQAKLDGFSESAYPTRALKYIEARVWWEKNKDRLKYDRRLQKFVVSKP